MDVAGGTIEVWESWGAKAGRIEPKTRTSRRRVPMPAALRELILDRRLEEATAAADALVFGRGVEEPFHAATLYRRADTGWKAAGLTERLRLHRPTRRRRRDHEQHHRTTVTTLRCD